MKNILVIKLGALGDFVQATAALQAIRKQHPQARITLLTTPPMKAFTKNLPWVDDIIWDSRSSPFNLKYMFNLRQKLRGFDFVYDLQTNDRSNKIYYRLAGKPAWNGIAKGCSHPQTNPNRNAMHSLDRLKDQLAAAGITMNEHPDIRYMAEPLSPSVETQLDALKKPFAILIPGGSAHRPGKRWPHFADIVPLLEAKGIAGVLVGGSAEETLLQHIAEQSGALNLCGALSLNQLPALFSKAKLFIGNDTGPTHMAAACHLGGAVLFGHESDPALCAPRGEDIHILHNQDIAAISPQQVVQKLSL